MPNAPSSLAARNRRPALRNRGGLPWTPFLRPASESPRAASLFPGLWLAYFRFGHSFRSQLGGGLRPSGPNFLVAQPRLEHGRVPQSRRPIALAGKVLGPPLSQCFRLEKSLLTQTRFAEEVLGPVAQRAAQPFRDWRRKTFFGTLHESRRNVLMQNSPQQPFALIPPLFKRSGKTIGEFYDSMIQQWNTRFQADRHGSPIHFHQYIVRKVRNEVQIHHPLQ